MDQFWLGLGAIVGLALVIWLVWIEMRLKKLASSTLLAMEKLKDEKIAEHIKTLSDAELDALLSDDISGHPKN